MTDDEYIPKGEMVDKEGDTTQLSVIPLPPDHVMKSAFLTAIKYRSVNTALKAYYSCINELSHIKDAQAGLNRAQMEELRTIELLKDAGTVHATDSARRKTELLRAEEHQIQIEHEAYLNKLDREAEKLYAKRQHAKLMASEEEEETSLSQEDQETKEWLESKVMRNSKEKEIAELIRKENKLTPDQEQILQATLAKLATISEG